MKFTSFTVALLCAGTSAQRYHQPHGPHQPSYNQQYDQRPHQPHQPQYPQQYERPHQRPHERPHQSPHQSPHQNPHQNPHQSPHSPRKQQPLKKWDSDNYVPLHDQDQVDPYALMNKRFPKHQSHANRIWFGDQKEKKEEHLFSDREHELLNIDRRDEFKRAEIKHNYDEKPKEHKEEEHPHQYRGHHHARRHGSSRHHGRRSSDRRPHNHYGPYQREREHEHQQNHITPFAPFQDYGSAFHYDDQKPAEEKRPQEHEDITLPHPNQYLPKIEEAPLKPETDLSVFGEKKEEEKPSYEQPHEPEHKPEPEHKQQLEHKELPQEKKEEPEHKDHEIEEPHKVEPPHQPPHEPLHEPIEHPEPSYEHESPKLEPIPLSSDHSLSDYKPVRSPYEHKSQNTPQAPVVLPGPHGGRPKPSFDHRSPYERDEHQEHDGTSYRDVGPRHRSPSHRYGRHSDGPSHQYGKSTHGPSRTREGPNRYGPSHTRDYEQRSSNAYRPQPRRPRYDFDPYDGVEEVEIKPIHERKIEQNHPLQGHQRPNRGFGFKRPSPHRRHQPEIHSSYKNGLSHLPRGLRAAQPDIPQDMSEQEVDELSLFTPAPELTRSTIAVCEFKELAGIGGVIGYTQTPGAPIAVAGTLTGGEAGDVFDIKITQYGDITNDCTKMGLEFNAWGKQSKMASVAYQSGSMQQFVQDNLLQNLAGEDSLIGRGLRLYRNDQLVGCGAISRAGN